MPRRPLHRLATAFFVVLSLLCSQLALASYVCPQQADLAAMAAMMEAGQPCGGMDPQQPALCHEQAAHPAKALFAAELPVLGQPALVSWPEPAWLPGPSVAQALPPAAVSEGRPPPAPLFLATRRLRV